MCNVQCASDFQKHMEVVLLLGVDNGLLYRVRQTLRKPAKLTRCPTLLIALAIALRSPLHAQARRLYRRLNLHQKC